MISFDYIIGREFISWERPARPGSQLNSGIAHLDSVPLWVLMAVRSQNLVRYSNQ